MRVMVSELLKTVLRLRDLEYEVTPLSSSKGKGFFVQQITLTRTAFGRVSVQGLGVTAIAEDADEAVNIVQSLT